MQDSDLPRAGGIRLQLAFAGLVLTGALLYTARVAESPPGFYLDESSIAFNAHTIAQTGRDEHGVAWPLFFRAFGEYKNPTYIYLLAGLFGLTGPSIVVARLLSASLAIGAALAVALLAWRLTRRRDATLLAGLAAMLTPWLFELGHVVLEVALYPLAVALSLLAVRRAVERARWSWGDGAAIAAALALLTYSYSIGRLLGPLLALALAVFTTRSRPFEVLRAWLPYACLLVPLGLFHHRHPGALTGRFRAVSYLDPRRGVVGMSRDLLEHVAANLDPRRLLATGDPNPHQVAHLYGSAPLLAATGILVLLGVWRAWLAEGVERRWWGFVACGLGAAVVPASLTVDRFHTLRLAAVPVFLLVLTIPAWAWLLAGGRRRWTRRAIAMVLLGGSIVQAATFQHRYHASADAASRVHLFDGEYEKWILEPALASSRRPIYLADAPAIPGYIQAYWHATLRGVPLAELVHLSAAAGPPAGSLVISTEPACPRCRVLGWCEPYTLYLADQPPRLQLPLADGELHGTIRALNPLRRLPAGEQGTIRVIIVNSSQTVWLARQPGTGPLQISLGNHWLDASGRTLVRDDGRATLPRDLGPGEQIELRLVVNAPQEPGEYLLELDLLQEGVAWFGDKGAPTVKLQVNVE